MDLRATVPMLVMLIALAAGCGGGTIGSNSGNGSGSDAGVQDGAPWPPLSDVGPAVPDGPGPNYDAFFADDPPPAYCGPDGGWTPPELPGGTPECPDDKNREGCPCTKRDEKAPCWPGLRKNRDRGICKDGETVCQLIGEHYLRWGPCEGYVLPKPGATKGADACMCFSKGQWYIKNLSPCIVTFSNGEMWAVSTYMDSSGQAHCPQHADTPPPQPQSGEPWSENTLTVDCAGQFKLCFTIKAGDSMNPQATDCVMAQTCTEAWYPSPNVTQPLPPLDAWVGQDSACTKAFVETGGYGEMSVVGTSIECESIDDNGQPLVFLRVTYCPLKCAQDPSLPECAQCGNGAGGSF